jgi:hypothetical protein
MTKGATRPLAELRAELARQDAQWARAKAQLRAACDGITDLTLAVPTEALEAIDRACSREPARAATPIGANVGADTPTGQQLTLRDSMATAIDTSGHLQALLDQPGGGDSVVQNYRRMLTQNPNLTDQGFVQANGGTNNNVGLGAPAVQSLMSDRQTSIQMCTNLVQPLADQTKDITSNIGH